MHQGAAAGGITGCLLAHPGIPGNAASIRAVIALAALEMYWGDTYDLGCSAGIWQARRRDGAGTVLTAGDPAGLHRTLAGQAGFVPSLVSRRPCARYVLATQAQP